MSNHQLFNALFEQYVFAVADKFIESASPEGQTALINLLYIEKPSPANKKTKPVEER